ncbi:EndoU domain-containing protein [Variovorax sp. DT-64]|uniref:EndoU domain-containing protein n=1 Tax=Variovorax sp. DT-64 TaxID=3396160 RepID=UPI003F19C5A6
MFHGLAATKPPDANGIYEGTVQVQNPAGQWVDKSKPSTFFPQSWSEGQAWFRVGRRL